MLPEYITHLWSRLQLASPRAGVIGINYRQVPCNFKPARDLGPLGWPSGWPGSSYCACCPATVSFSMLHFLVLASPFLLRD